MTDLCKANILLNKRKSRKSTPLKERAQSAFSIYLVFRQYLFHLVSLLIQDASSDVLTGKDIAIPELGKEV